jgi:mono/diheme cytochrome c family protein
VNRRSFLSATGAVIANGTPNAFLPTTMAAAAPSGKTDHAISRPTLTHEDVIPLMKRMLVLTFLVLGIGAVAGEGRSATLRVTPAPNPGAESTAGAMQASDAKPSEDDGAKAFARHCAICHGDNREGILPSFPSLIGVERHLTNQQITDIIHGGRGRMPGFPHLPETELTALLRFLGTSGTPISSVASGSTNSASASPLVQAGGALFQQSCAFCHGRDAAGGEIGPDLTRSKLVAADVGGDKISEVVRNGRPEKKMPAFNFSNQELLGLAAFIHAQQVKAVAQKGNRRGVDVSDLQTGDIEAGKQYFNGAGGCAKCHSPTGDLSGVATRFEGLQLEEQMLYPKGVKSKVSVTLPSGKQITGVLAYQDEFTVALRDETGTYRSWAVGTVKYTIDEPLQAHAEQFSKYTDSDIHNLMAYIQTLR